jgi:hypothetical protein
MDALKGGALVVVVRSYGFVVEKRYSSIPSMY